MHFKRSPTPNLGGAGDQEPSQQQAIGDQQQATGDQHQATDSQSCPVQEATPAPDLRRRKYTGSQQQAIGDQQQATGNQEPSQQQAIGDQEHCQQEGMHFKRSPTPNLGGAGPLWCSVWRCSGLEASRRWRHSRVQHLRCNGRASKGEER